MYKDHSNVINAVYLIISIAFIAYLTFKIIT